MWFLACELLWRLHHRTPNAWMLHNRLWNAALQFGCVLFWFPTLWTLFWWWPRLLSSFPFLTPFCSLQVGLSHADVLRLILHHASARILPTFPLPKWEGLSTFSSGTESQRTGGKQKVYVLFGGDTSERQVSLISGTNVWLNLQACSDVSCSKC